MQPSTDEAGAPKRVRAVLAAAVRIARSVATQGRSRAAVAAQLAGTGGALTGFSMLVGPAWTLLVGGVALLGVGTLAEWKGAR
ncbi:hypothetical protein [Amycolatopsis sp. NPDC051128]|uniref:hypothetical protein n=1 Tax=Amycolatopsis sp. NPDC051128 TaxID=3155412 RepID=UPI0034218BBE